MHFIFLLKRPSSPLRLDFPLKGKRGENRWRRYQPLHHNSGGKNLHQTTTTYSFISSDLDSRSRLAALWGFLREWPAWKRLHHRRRGRPLAESSWPPPRDDLGRSSARPHQGAAVLQILRVNFYDRRLCKVMHIDFHFFLSLFYLFFIRVEGTYVSDGDVSCLGISRGWVFFFLFFFFFSMINILLGKSFFSFSQPS